MDDARIEALLRQLPREVAPPVDLWQTIETRLDRGNEPTEELLGVAARDVTPPDELWRAIAAEIDPAVSGEAVTNPRARNSRARYRLPLAIAAAAAATLIVVAQLVQLRDVDSPAPEDPAFAAAANRASGPLSAADSLVFSAPAPASLAEAQATIAAQILAVRSEREAIEASLSLYPGDAALLDLWRHTYETELLLIDDASRVMTNI